MRKQVLLPTFCLLLLFTLSNGCVFAQNQGQKNEIIQKIPAYFMNGEIDVVKHRMKNNLHLFSLHFTNSGTGFQSKRKKSPSTTYYIATDIAGSYKWSLKFHTSNQSYIQCLPNDIIDTDDLTIFKIYAKNNESIYINDKVVNPKNETNLLVFVNKVGAITQIVKFTSASLHPEFGLVVSQANSNNDFACLVENRYSLTIDGVTDETENGIYLLKFSKDVATKKYTIQKKKIIGKLMEDTDKRNNSLAGLQLYLSNNDVSNLYSTIHNNYVKINNYTNFISVKVRDTLEKRYEKNRTIDGAGNLFCFDKSLSLIKYYSYGGKIRGLTEDTSSNLVILNSTPRFHYIAGKKTVANHSLIFSLENNPIKFNRYDSLAYELDFLRSVDNYQTSNMVTYIRYVYDSQLLKHYKILRRYTNEKLDDVISMEEPLIDSRAVISKDGKYIHCMNFSAKMKSKNKKTFPHFSENTILIQHEDLFKIEKNKVAKE
jgi:hypothetical protein